VRRVQVGDRVIVNVLPHCGQCYGCLRGRRCMAFNAGVPFADTEDGTPVIGSLNVGGMAELMVPYEESVVPVFTSVPPAQLSLLHCVSGCGLGMTTTMGVFRGSDVAVFGAGPVGLSSMQGARILGAKQIIAVEPIKVRRDLALKLGATTALDPNV